MDQRSSLGYVHFCSFEGFDAVGSSKRQLACPRHTGMVSTVEDDTPVICPSLFLFLLSKNFTEKDWALLYELSPQKDIKVCGAEGEEMHMKTTIHSELKKV